MLRDSGLWLGLAASVAWGFWALFVRLAERTMPPEAVLVVSYVTGGAIGVVALLATPASSTWTPSSAGFAVAAGLASGVGSLLYYTGIRAADADVGIVTTVTGLYFVVAALLGIVVLDEGVTVEKVGGLVFAALAVVLFTR